MKKLKILKVAIDSEASAGGGTQAKLISNQYNLFYLDTGKIYRLIALYFLLVSTYPYKWWGTNFRSSNFGWDVNIEKYL